MEGFSRKAQRKRLNESTSNEGLFKKVSEECSATKEGPKIHKKLAEIVKRAFSKPLEIQKQKNLFERRPKPTSTDKIVIPKMNREIWATFSSRAKKKNAKALELQQTIVHSTFCILQLENNDIKEKVIKNLTDTAHMFGPTNYDLSLKDVMLCNSSESRSHISISLCAPEAKVTKFLFCKDVARTSFKPNPGWI